MADRKHCISNCFERTRDERRNRGCCELSTGDPAIFQRSIEAQLTTLIINPLTQLSKTGTFQSTPVPNLIIIDGLDECNDHRVQQHILHTNSTAVQQPDVPLKF